ncbi:hypothetical protein [Desulfoluna spongiiphila]|uniref:hypothetical protein n=1 Tax=Desulfoluna spongiiphila TaxID=419481 RepID=UPI00125AECDA|nr:hypothetical protein [Desulfoluna spongiiphila]VVS95366.1 hypothetical protein DBB_49430 [Desulfoluna spongiiphila]
MHKRTFGYTRKYSQGRKEIHSKIGKDFDIYDKNIMKYIEAEEDEIEAIKHACKIPQDELEKQYGNFEERAKEINQKFDEMVKRKEAEKCYHMAVSSISQPKYPCAASSGYK